MKFPFRIDFTSSADVKRLQSALALKEKDFEVNRQSGAGLFRGSAPEPYQTSLASCGCKDFFIRRQPCKHMIRLAVELGYEFDFPVFNPKAAADYDVYEDIERLQSRWKAGQLTTDAYAACLTALEKSSKKAVR